MTKAFLPALRGASAVLILIAGTASALAEDAKGHVPKKAGQCVRTEISELGSRLEGSPDSGSAIAYANGVTGVSYDIITAIRRSRAGDPRTLCLVSVPRNCPPGDDRGKVYCAVNGRTQERWSLPDSHIAAAARRRFFQGRTGTASAAVGRIVPVSRPASVSMTGLRKLCNRCSSAAPKH